MIVVDTNVMTSLVVDGENAVDSTALLEHDAEWAAPTILISELRNVLLGFVRKGNLTPDQAKAMCDDAALVLGGRIISVSGSRVIDTALECGLTAYDAEFVVLARALRIPLATSDRAILAGAPDIAAPPSIIPHPSLRHSRESGNPYSDTGRESTSSP